MFFKKKQDNQDIPLPNDSELDLEADLPPVEEPELPEPVKAPEAPQDVVNNSFDNTSIDEDAQDPLGDLNKGIQELDKEINSTEKELNKIDKDLEKIRGKN